MKKYVVYPYDEHAYSLVENWKKLHDSEIISIVAPKSFGLEGKDGGKAYGNKVLGYKVESNLEQKLRDCDGIIVPEITKERILPSVLKNMEEVLNSGKDVTCFCRLEAEYIDKYRDLATCKKAEFCYCWGDTENKYDSGYDGPWYVPNIPVVVVGDTLPEMEAGNIAVGLAAEFRERGYRSIAFVESRYRCSESTIAFPSFLIENDCQMTEDKKVIAFNSFTKKSINEYNPDILIIQLPKSIIRQNIYDKFNFGVLSYIISQAVSADYFILCDILRGLREDEFDSFYEELGKCFWYRFGFKPDEVCLCNIKMDNAGSFARGELVNYLANEDELTEIEQVFGKKKKALPLYSRIHTTSAMYCERILDKLSSDS